jgi:hypothetical protein
MTATKPRRRTRRRCTPESIASFHVFDDEAAAAEAELCQKAPSPEPPKTSGPPAVAIFHDKLMRSLLVVQVGATWHLLPNEANGWARRLPLNMSDEAKRERLWRADGITPAYLSIPSPHSEQTQ